MELRTEMVKFDGGGSPLPGYLAQPMPDGNYPGVVVIQEWWGLNDHIKDVTERLAREGFVALAPDLYRGEVAHEPDDARRLVMAVERHERIQDIQGAVDYLRTLSNVQPKQVGVMGFCFGGALAMMMASLGEHVGAVASFYGGGIKLDDETAAKVSAPVLGIFGEADGGIPVELVRANESLLREHGKVIDFHIYPNAPHAFFNDTRTHSYVQEAAEDAWQKTLGWFRTYLV
jgi:carboxymethylenebutenolidase